MSATIEVPVADKVLLTIQEASAVFNIGESRMRDFAKDLPNIYTVKIGNKYLINKKKLEEFFEKNRFFD